jgi:hypothetical protein
LIGPLPEAVVFESAINSRYEASISIRFLCISIAISYNDISQNIIPSVSFAMLIASLALWLNNPGFNALKIIT